MSTDKRYPRTLQEAFGPYTDNVIHEEPKTLFAWLPRRVSQTTVASYQQDVLNEHASMQIPDND